MEEIILDILGRLRGETPVTDKDLNALLARYNRDAGTQRRAFVKKALLPYYLRMKEQEPQVWEGWQVDEETEERLLALLRMKPRRTASGVATVTVITKPWPCSGSCIYCPNDIRMPKSYLSDEPACQRAERNFFDPYLQMHSRLHTLGQMGHPTDKVEVIVLGGTWTDYPQSYRIWFMEQIYEALNDGDTDLAHGKSEARMRLYREAGFSSERDELARLCRDEQTAIDEGRRSYNEAFIRLYGPGSPWERAAAFQQADFAELAAQQRENETAARRQVGLVVETRPDAVTADVACELRAYGCTKVQLGIQSLRPEILEANGRTMDPSAVADAMAVLRLFGFKIHIHFMANLLGADPTGDAADYRRLVEDARYLPDEVKLYPCVLVGGTELEKRHEEGLWAPYDEETLVELLRENALVTPCYTRISRMIRDISAHDIKAGNRKTNLRQMVEKPFKDSVSSASKLNEIRSREIAGGDVDEESLTLSDVGYATAVSRERFLQWVTPEDRIAGFLRLSLPKPGMVSAIAKTPEVAEGGCGKTAEDGMRTRPREGEAMIREVHIYGRTARMHRQDDGVQHRGLGKRLIARAVEIARDEGYDALNVISAVGTRDYYRGLGFEDDGLYQRLPLR